MFWGSNDSGATASVSNGSVYANGLYTVSIANPTSSFLQSVMLTINDTLNLSANALYDMTVTTRRRRQTGPAGTLVNITVRRWTMILIGVVPHSERQRLVTYAGARFRSSITASGSLIVKEKRNNREINADLYNAGTVKKHRRV